MKKPNSFPSFTAPIFILTNYNKKSLTNIKELELV